MSKIPKAIHGSPDSPLIIGDKKMQCYVLEGGIRVLSGRGMQDALGLGQGHGGLLKEFLGSKAIKELIPNDLAMEVSNPIKFMRPGRGGRTALGYEATILQKICDAILEARKAGHFDRNKRMQRIATECELLVRAFAKVGIIALIDEITGYQKDRQKDALQNLLAAYIREEFLPWTKKFPDEFYQQLFRLKKWTYNPMSVKRPQVLGKITENIVYKRIHPAVLVELKRLNPKNQSGNRTKRHHQFLTNDIGNPHLEKHIASLITLMRISPDWLRFKRHVERAFPIQNGQLTIGFTDMDEDEIDK